MQYVQMQDIDDRKVFISPEAVAYVIEYEKGSSVIYMSGDKEHRI